MAVPSPDGCAPPQWPSCSHKTRGYKRWINRGVLRERQPRTPVAVLPVPVEVGPRAVRGPGVRVAVLPPEPDLTTVRGD